MLRSILKSGGGEGVLSRVKMIRDTLPRVVVGGLIKVRRLVVQDGIQGGRGVTLCQARGKRSHRQCQGGQHLVNETIRQDIEKNSSEEIALQLIQK